MRSANSRTTKGRRALGGHELRGRVAKGLASMLWDTCKTVVCLFWPPPLWLHFQIPINGILFSWSRSTFPSLSSFTAGHLYSLTDTVKHPASRRLYLPLLKHSTKLLLAQRASFFLPQYSVSLARCKVFWFLSRRFTLHSGCLVWWLVCFFLGILLREQPQDFDLNEDSNYCLSFKSINYYSKYMTKYICHADSCTYKQLCH